MLLLHQGGGDRGMVGGRGGGDGGGGGRTAHAVGGWRGVGCAAGGSVAAGAGEDEVHVVAGALVDLDVVLLLAEYHVAVVAALGGEERRLLAVHLDESGVGRLTLIIAMPEKTKLFFLNHRYMAFCIWRQVHTTIQQQVIALS